MKPLLRRLLRRKSRPHSGDWSENPSTQPRGKTPRKLRPKRRGSSHSGDWTQNTANAPGRKAGRKRLGKLPQGIKKRKKLLLIVGGVVAVVVVIVIAAGVGGGKKKTSTNAGPTTTTSTGPTGTNTLPLPKAAPHRSMLDAARLDPAVNSIKQHLGTGARVIQVTISDQGVQVEYDFNGRIGFLLGEPTSSAIRKVTSVHLKPGKRRTFAVAVLDPAVPTALRAHAGSVGGSGYKVTTLLLKPDPVTKRLQWTIFDTSHPGFPRLVANVDGSAFRKAS